MYYTLCLLVAVVFVFFFLFLVLFVLDLLLFFLRYLLFLFLLFFLFLPFFFFLLLMVQRLLLCTFDLSKTFLYAASTSSQHNHIKSNALPLLVSHFAFRSSRPQ